MAEQQGGDFNERMAALRNQQSQQAPAPAPTGGDNFQNDMPDPYEEADFTSNILSWVKQINIKGVSLIYILFALSLFGILSILSSFIGLFVSDEPPPQEVATIAPNPEPTRITPVDTENMTLDMQGSELMAQSANDSGGAPVRMGMDETEGQTMGKATQEQDKMNEPAITPHPTAQIAKEANPPPLPRAVPPNRKEMVVRAAKKRQAKKPASVQQAAATPQTREIVKPQPRPANIIQAQATKESEASLANLHQDFNSKPFAPTTYQLQLGAFKHLYKIENLWFKLKARHHSLVKDIYPHIIKVNYGSSGVHHRLHVGPFKSKAEADRLCVRLQAADFDCILVSPQTEHASKS